VARIISSRYSQRDSLLFVYGTLRPFVEIPIARWLQTVARYVGPAKVRGRLYDLGPYPALRPPRRNGDWVFGDVYAIRDPFVMRALDSYEAGRGAGPPRFVRCACLALAPRGPAYEAWAYLYRGHPSPRSRILSGDYRARRHFT
jgi:gamma-glutamylcyclotransferase (GGCT)/AIG2-like uncharacterized protein YtfP